MKLFITIGVLCTFALNSFCQTIAVIDWKITTLKIRSIKESTIEVDSINSDAFPRYEAFYDTTGKITEKRYHFRLKTLTSREFEYTLMRFIYDKNGTLKDTLITNKPGAYILTPGPLINSDYNNYSECNYYNKQHELIKTEMIADNSKYEIIYTYKEFEKNGSWSIELPVQIGYYTNSKLESSTLIDYAFY